MATPSIAMIPSGYKAGKVYSVLPTDGAGDLDFTRASSATRINKEGLLETVATGVPRLDYSDGGCPSLLLEPQRTNLVTYSEDFSNAAWIKGNSSITSNAAISPDGTLNADKLVESTSAGVHKLRVNHAFASVDYSASIRIKPNGVTNVSLWFDTASKGTRFDLSTGTIYSETSSVGTITALSDGWFEISTTADGTSGTSWAIYFYDALWNFSYTGDGTSGVYIWGAQLEQGSYATSYTPTAGAIATRLADVASKTGLGSYINSSEGVLFAEIAALADDLTYRVLSISDGTDAERIYIQYTNASNTVAVVVKNGGSTQANMVYVLSDETQFSKIAIKWKVNDFALWINGVEVGTDNSGSVPLGLNRLAFDNASTTNFYGKVKQIQVFTTALTDAELQALTS